MFYTQNPFPCTSLCSHPTCDVFIADPAHPCTSALFSSLANFSFELALYVKISITPLPWKSIKNSRSRCFCYCRSVFSVFTSSVRLHSIFVRTCLINLHPYRRSLLSNPKIPFRLSFLLFLYMYYIGPGFVSLFQSINQSYLCIPATQLQFHCLVHFRFNT